MIHELKIKPTLKSFTDSSKTKKKQKEGFVKDIHHQLFGEI